MLKPFADDAGIIRVINAAQNVPSAYKPWSFWIRDDDRIELRANFRSLAPRRSEDQIRRLNVIHPLCREPLISAGMALFNLRLAIRATGHDDAAWLLPDPDNDPSLLASVEIVTGRIRRPPVAVQELYDAIPRRRTLPELFDGPPVRENIIATMVLAAFEKQGWLRPLDRSRAKTWLQEAASAADELDSNETFPVELRRWTGEDTWEFVPTPALRRQAAADRAGKASPGGTGPDETRATRRFPPAWPRRRSPDPQLMTLATRGDRPLDWLYAGLAVQRAILLGACHGVSVSFVTQPLQLADVRASRAGIQPQRKWPWKWPFPELPQLVLWLGQTGQAVASVAERRDGRYPEVLDLRGAQPREVLPPGKGKAA